MILKLENIVEALTKDLNTEAYIKHGGLFVSIPKDMDPLTITLEEAETLIKNKQEAEANKLIKAFAELPGLEVLNGRFGPYLAYKKDGKGKAQNFKIPKTLKAEEITFEQAQKLMKDVQNKGESNGSKVKTPTKKSVKSKK